MRGLLASEIDEVEPDTSLTLPVALTTVQAIRSAFIALQVAFATSQTSCPRIGQISYLG